MKAKYKHEGNDCIIYDQVICEDNIVVTVRTYYGSWIDAEPETKVKVCSINAEAKKLFYSLCKEYENSRYDCLYQYDEAHPNEKGGYAE